MFKRLLQVDLFLEFPEILDQSQDSVWNLISDNKREFLDVNRNLTKNLWIRKDQISCLNNRSLKVDSKKEPVLIVLKGKVLDARDVKWNDPFVDW